MNTDIKCPLTTVRSIQAEYLYCYISLKVLFEQPKNVRNQSWNISTQSVTLYLYKKLHVLNLWLTHHRLRAIFTILCTVLTKTKFFAISSLTSARSDWNRAMWSAPDSRAIVSKLRPMWIMTSVLCWSYGLISDTRNRRSSRTHGRLYGVGGTAWWLPGHTHTLFNTRTFSILHTDIEEST